MSAAIDVAFDFRSDTPAGRDPDRYSGTLRRYHKLLWSKPLPDGTRFGLTDAAGGRYLYHRSLLGEFALSSDAVVPSFKWVPHVKQAVPQSEIEEFCAIGYTIGGMMIWPGNTINGKWTINQARGCTRSIRDRFDLTLECIRRHYCGTANPLADVLARYADFFRLFRDFRGFIEFFMLQDLVSDDCSAVRITPPFDDFQGSPIPASTQAYYAYRREAIAFIEARNRRIREWSAGVA